MINEEIMALRQVLAFLKPFDCITILLGNFRQSSQLFCGQLLLRLRSYTLNILALWNRQGYQKITKKNKKLIKSANELEMAPRKNGYNGKI